MSENKKDLSEVKEQTDITSTGTAAPEPVKKKKGKAKALAAIIAAVVILAGAGGGYVYYDNYQKTVVIPERRYNEAIEMYNAEQYEEAMAVFEELGDYRNTAKWKESTQKQIERAAHYAEAEKLLQDGEYKEAYNAFTGLSGYSDSEDRAEEIYEEYLSPIAVIRNAEIGDKVNIYYKGVGPEWRVLAKEDNKVLLYETFTDFNNPQWKYDVGYVDPNLTHYFEKVDFTQYIDPEIADYLIEPGPFIPHMSLYDQYIKKSDAFVHDDKTWIVKFGSGHYATETEFVYLPRFIGPDNEVYKHNTPSKPIFRYFVWIDVSK